jgi:UDP-4-amino-4,6-dideoxy-N-acetyl-beta-L-altrosamine transaminase
VIPYGRQTIDDEDINAVVEVLRSDWLTQGPKIQEFERALAARGGAKHAVVMANGTAALQAAYYAAGLGPGDELVTTPLTFAATANAALWFGAKPVFADIDESTGNLSPDEAARKITSRTKVLAPVDYAGRPADLPAFRELAKKHGLLLVEDACHSYGASLGSSPVGSLADMTVLSFHPVKTLTTGEGGAVLTNDEALAAKLSSFRAHGVTSRQPDWRYDIGHLAQNYRMTDMQAALGLSQLRKLDRFIARRQEIAEAYLRDFAGVPELGLPPTAAPGQCAWHLFPIRVPRRAEVFRSLRAAGVGVQVHYIPVHHHSLYRGLGYPEKLCPRAERFYDEELSLPIFPLLTEADRKKVVSAVKDALVRNPAAKGGGR